MNVNDMEMDKLVKKEFSILNKKYQSGIFNETIPYIAIEVTIKSSLGKEYFNNISNFFSSINFEVEALDNKIIKMSGESIVSKLESLYKELLKKLTSINEEIDIYLKNKNLDNPHQITPSETYFYKRYSSLDFIIIDIVLLFDKIAQAYETLYVTNLFSAQESALNNEELINKLNETGKVVSETHKEALAELKNFEREAYAKPLDSLPDNMKRLYLSGSKIEEVV